MICQHCNKQEGNWMVNPYYQDIDGVEIMEYICDSCYENLIGIFKIWDWIYQM